MLVLNFSEVIFNASYRVYYLLRIRNKKNYGSGKWDLTTDRGLMGPAEQFFKLDISYQIKLKVHIVSFF